MFRFLKRKPKPPQLSEPLLHASHVAEFNEQAANLKAQVQAIAEQLEQAMQGDSEREKALKERIEVLEQDNAWLRAQLEETRKSNPDGESSGASLRSPIVTQGDESS